MTNEVEDQFRAALVDVVADAFNRSISALEACGAIDTAELKSRYKGVGSQYYDLVSDQISRTVNAAMPGILKTLRS